MTHKVWMTQAAYLIGLGAFLTLPFRTDPWALWVALSILVYLFLVCVISVGHHRLFCHNSFETSNFWRLFLMYTSVFSVYGSPIQWAATHQSHHDNADTERDPYPEPSRWSVLWRVKYRVTKSNGAASRRLIADSRQVFLHRNYAFILLAGCALMLIVSPAFFTNAFLPGLGLSHLATRLHILLAHGGNQPRDLWGIEFLMPTGGEWYHRQHHNRPGAWRFGRWDMSAFVISRIKL